MNVDSEQIAQDGSLVLAQDQPLSDRQLQDCIIRLLGKDKCRLLPVPPRRWVLEYVDSGKVCHLLVRACTYLGNPHPIFKKRMQLPLWFNEYVRSARNQSPEVDVRYLGVYHYGDEQHGDNVVFVDFAIDTFLAKTGHNSSAHVYTNDLYQAMKYGIFSKVDHFGNTITTVRCDKLCDYLRGAASESNTLLDLFRQFNGGFGFGQWLKALDSIKEMHLNGWRQWRQAEWPGFYLEYRFDKFTRDNNVTDKMRYVGNSSINGGGKNFDILFGEEPFYGDLKASNISQKETPLNDKSHLVDCIKRYGRFWYVIFEHETVTDSQAGYVATKDRIRYIKSVDPSFDKDEMSYGRRMKNSVRFLKMSIVELNPANYWTVLKDFNQGRQQSGEARNPKFKITKEVLKNDNYVVFRHTFIQ